MRSMLGAIVCAAALATPPLADADQRYVVAAGAEGEECTQSAPCSLKVGVRNAQSGDEVILAPGTYEVDEPIAPELGVTGVQIQGASGGPVPKVVATTGFNPPFGVNGVVNVLSRLEIVNEGPAAKAFACGGGRVERVRLRAKGAGAIGLEQAPGCIARDSVVRAQGTEAIAVRGVAAGGDSEVTDRNLTAIATGEKSVGVLSEFVEFFFGAGSITVGLKNVIASGEASDLRTHTFGSFSASRIVVANSNFDTTDEEGGESKILGSANQTAPPIFADAVNGDFREVAGSPTIDAGVEDQLGATDLEGNPRVLGSAPDIGAHEFVPPAGPGAQIQSLAIAPKVFRAANFGGAIISARKEHAPVGATVSYTLSLAASVDFTVERKTVGRTLKGKCVKRTRTNSGKRKCALFKPLKSGLAVSGATGQNEFKFSGRLGSRALKPGSYRLVGSAGGGVKRASFRIVK